MTRQLITEAELRRWITEQLALEEACVNVVFEGPFTRLQVEGPQECNWAPNILRGMENYNTDCQGHLRMVLAIAQRRYNLR